MKIRKTKIKGHECILQAFEASVEMGCIFECGGLYLYV